MRLKSFLDRAPVNILIVDRGGRVVRVSRAMAKLARVSPEKCADRTVAELLPDIASLLQPSIEKALKGETVDFEIDVEPGAYLRAGGHWSVSTFPFGKLEIGIIVSEVTERRRIEDAFEQTQCQLEKALANIERNNLVIEMAHFLQASNTREELYNIVGRFGARLFPGNSGALCIINASKNMIEVVAGWGDGAMFEPVFSLDDCWALREGRLHVVHDPTAELVCAHVSAHSGSQLCIPMMAQSETLGILHLSGPASKPAEDIFATAEVRLIQRVAEEIGLPFANLRLRETLQNQALRDPLTGLYNRRFFLDALDRELRRAVRKHSSMGVIMLDIDYFKQYNDAHGHAAGDALLRSVSALLQARVRAGDILCRYGGDEFSILMPEATLKDTTGRAEELRQSFKLFNFEWRGHGFQAVTISLGAAAFPSHGTTAETLLNEADAGLYLAKSAGRDQVMTSIPLRSSSAASQA